MKTNTDNKRWKYEWVAFLGLMVFLFATFASVQEKICNFSSLGASLHFVAQAEQGHSEHCIRHQNPLPQVDIARSASPEPVSLAFIASTRFNSIEKVFSQVKAPVPNSLPFSGNGIPTYKRLSHFLI